jgi:hypothetical protein
VIDPVPPATTVISYLLTLTDIRERVGEQVAAKHEYGQVTEPDETPRGWELGSRAITLRLAGADGEPDTARCAPQHRVRLEARCYGGSSEEAELVWSLLFGVCTQFQRGPVTLPDGRDVLLSLLWPLDGPFAEYDPDTGMDYVRTTLRTVVSSTSV